MKIVCPNCQFGREIDLASIPSTATTATCPKCEQKFAFREALPDYSREKPKGIIIDSINTNSLPKPTEKIEEKEISTNTNPIEEEKIQTPQIDLEKNISKNLEDLNPEELTEEEQIQRAHAIYRRQAEQSEQLKQEGSSQVYIMVPWEINGYEPNIFAKFFQTITRVLFSSPAFFATMYRPFPISRAVLFYICIGLLQFLARMTMLQFNPSVNTALDVDPQVLAVLEFMQEPSTLVLGLFISPFILIMQLLIISTILYTVIRLVEPKSADFSLIARMIAYSSAPGLLSIIPVLGDAIALPWIVFNIVIACRFALNLSIPKVLLTIGAFIVFVTLVILMFFPIGIVPAP